MNIASLAMAWAFMGIAWLAGLAEVMRRDQQILWLRRTFLLAMTGAMVLMLLLFWYVFGLGGLVVCAIMTAILSATM